MATTEHDYESDPKHLRKLRDAVSYIASAKCALSDAGTLPDAEAEQLASEAYGNLENAIDGVRMALEKLGATE